MPFTNAGAQNAIYNMGSNISNNYIQTVEVGYGSGTAAITNVTLVNGSIRVMQTGSPNFTTNLKVSFQGDFTSVQMSGMNFTEFGLFNSGLLGVGSVWARESFGVVNFDGTSELQISYSINAIPG